MVYLIRCACAAAVGSGLFAQSAAALNCGKAAIALLHRASIIGSPMMTDGATAVQLTGASSIHIGVPAQYKATVVGASYQGVIWSVNGIAGGDSTSGTITTGGLYVPPAVVPAANSITITATSHQYPALSGSIAATLYQAIPVLSSIAASTEDKGLTFDIKVYGSSFTPDAIIIINGKPVTTTARDQNTLETGIANPGGRATTVGLSVENPNPGSALSSTAPLSLTPTLVSGAAAGRFLDQATFGSTAATIAHVQQIGLQAALAEQFNQPQSLFIDPTEELPQCGGNGNFHCTQSQFLSIAAWGNDQFRQRVAMALDEMWVASFQQGHTMPYYLNVLAADAFTNYRTIMEDVTLTPQMGVYLNMLNSGAPRAGQIANENYARELMQLFTMGTSLLNPDGSLQKDGNGNPIPAYTQAEVQAFARALTGWTSPNADGSIPARFTYRSWNRSMVSVENEHDPTAKVLLDGVVLPAGQTANQDLDAALDNIFNHPNVGPFVSRQLIQHLVTGDPSPAYVERVAAVFADNGHGVRGDMKAVLTAILLDPEARAGDAQSGDAADSAPEVNGGHLREPLLWTANLIRGLNATSTLPADVYPFGWLMNQVESSDGEAPFTQQSVFNYFSPAYAIPQTALNSPEFGIENTESIIPRLTIADIIIHGSGGLTVDVSPSSDLGKAASNPGELVDYLAMVFMHSQMPSAMRGILINTISAIPANNPQSRAQVAVYLVATSSLYKIMH